MKRASIALFTLLAGLTFAVPSMADDRRGGDRRNDYGYDYRGHHGYRERPYDHKRRYKYNEHRKHRYEYQGHWRSWDDFDHYIERYPNWRSHGHYYHDGVHLMFRTCPPDTGMCLFFSIGR